MLSQRQNTKLTKIQCTKIRRPEIYCLQTQHLITEPDYMCTGPALPRPVLGGVQSTSAQKGIYNVVQVHDTHAWILPAKSASIFYLPY